MDAAFDRDKLMDNMDGDVEFLAETVEMLAEQGAELIEQARQAIADGDGDALTMAAHTLKGMLGNFCAPAPYAVAQTLEQQAKAGQFAQADNTLTQLTAQLEQLGEALSQFVSEQMQ